MQLILIWRRGCDQCKMNLANQQNQQKEGGSFQEILVKISEAIHGV